MGWSWVAPPAYHHQERIFKTTNIGRWNFLLPFTRLGIHEISTKDERFQCAVTQAVLVKKLMKYKVNTNLKFSLPSKLPILIINAESYLFFPLLKPFFRRSNLPCFSFKIKDRIILLELVGMVKNNLSLFELDSKTSLVCHNALTSTKWRNMKTILTLILLVAMSTSASILSTNSLPAMVARHVEEFQVCVLERLWNFR